MLKKPVNENYAAVVTSLKILIPLENCDNVVHANIFGNLVVVGKDSKIGDVGLYFPCETALSPEFLKNNNLYRNAESNIDPTKKGFFEDKGRVKCVKFRGHKSQGLFIPLTSLSFTNHKENLTEVNTFDEIAGIPICKKYVVRYNNQGSSGKNNNKKGFKKKVSRLIENQFHYHIDTMQLGKSIYKIRPNNLLSISSKWHGTSLIVGNILCKKKLSIPEKILKFLRVNIVDSEYATIISSRKVVKNDDMNKVHQHFYTEDIWTTAASEIKDTLKPGMTYYAEICGYLSSGSEIQKGYDYGNEPTKHSIHIYRITSVNATGDVFEWSAKQVQDWCREHGLNAVKQLYYGYAKDLFPEIAFIDTDEGLKEWQQNFLAKLQETYLEKDCEYCKNKVPAEGIVLRKECNDIDVYKLKSFAFLERETKLMDKGEADIEEQVKE